jgi:serine/threonine protein kinase/Tfp pilus assembly protein PilF
VTIKEGTKLGRFEIRSQLGAGGMGEVYLAQDTKLDRNVAIKFLPERLVADEQARKRLVREARAAAKLDHPNICSIYEVSEDDGRSFIVMQHVEGETLDSRMKRKPLDFLESLFIGTQVADALAEAHTHGIIHRDIKPSNIIITSRGQAKVMDFGLAKLMVETVESEAETQSLLTTPGTIIGTMPYMSPEQVRGEKVDERSDIFSFGVVLYEMLTGQQPFAAGGGVATISAILTLEPRPVRDSCPDASDELQRIVSKCLVKDRERRYQAIREVAVDLETVRRRCDAGLSVVPTTDRATASARPAVTDHGAKRPAFLTSHLGLALAAVVMLAAVASVYALFFYFTHARSGAINSVAILPFVNMSKDPNTEYLSDGITDSLINSLSQLPNIRMIPRGSVFRYKGHEVDPQQVGRDLDVQAIVTGRITQLGDNLSISAELVDVRTNSHIWGEQYNRKLADILNVQTEITLKISERLRARLSGEDQKRIARRYTDNADAYQLYLKGRYFWDKRTGDGMSKARQSFNQAIELDPNYALAYSGLADTYLFCYCPLPRNETMPKAKAYATKALAIDDSLAEAHTSLAFVKMNYEFDWSGAEKEFTRAIELSPNYPVAHQFYGACLVLQGRTEEGLRECKRALELDPLSLAINWSLGLNLYHARQYDKAMEQLRKTIQMEPNYHLAHNSLGRVYLEKGMYAEALSEFQTASKLQVEPVVSASNLAVFYALSGNKSEAQRILDEVKQMPEPSDERPLMIARAYTALGEKDQAFEWLERAYQERAFSVFFLKVDPEFDRLRSDPRFADLMRRVGLTAVRV